MVAKAELAEINEILNPAADEPTEVTKPDEVVEDEVIADEVKETDEVVVEAADETTGEATDTTEQTYTPSQLAEAVGWETDDIYNSVVIPLQDGETIPLGEFKNKYQDLTRDNASLQTQLTEAQSGLEQAQTGVNQGQQLSQAMVQQMGYLESINRAEQNTDWDELESLDPSDAVLQRDKIRRAREEVQGNMQLIQNQEAQANQDFLGKAYAKMLDEIPEWKDEVVMKKDHEEMKVVMRKYGYVDNELNSIVDPRQMKAIKRLAYLEAKEKLATSAVSKVRAAPRSLKGRKVDPASNKDKVEGLVSKAKQSGDKRDAHNAIKALLSGNQ